jgi:hypothetical protein
LAENDQRRSDDQSDKALAHLCQVDYIINELKLAGLDVAFDRARLVPGQRLWTQLDQAISNPQLSDAWAIYATKNSLSSEPCLEELAYALDRALRARGHRFPIIGIFPEALDRSLIPSAIASRLYVDLRDPNWANKVAAGARLSAPQISTDVNPYIIQQHKEGDKLVVEVRLRAGRWYPFMVLVPDSDRGLLLNVVHGPFGQPPAACMVSRNDVDVQNLNGKHYKGIRIMHAVDHLNSAYIYLSAYPSEMIFGPSEGPGYQVLRRT